ncbi:MAG: glycosyltransferase family 2 protein [Desulfobacterales bacterium]
MISNPLVTALICNYNYGRYLAEAIESTLNQTWKNLEIIVVDDGSTDESREVLKKYEGKIRTILKENGGQASAFNAGIAEARGEITCFLDSDDYWYPEKVEKTVAKFKEASYGLVCNDLQEVNELGIKISNQTYCQSHKLFFQHRDLLEFIIEREFIWAFSPTSGISLPTSIAKKLLPLPEKEWRICADNPIAYGALCHAPIGVIKEPLGAYRYHGANCYASVIKNSVSLRLSNFITQIKSYLFLTDYLSCLGRTERPKEPKSSYRFYRTLCFITRESPWRYLFNLWKLNIVYHNIHKKYVNNPRLTTAWFLLLDTILVLLTIIKLPTPYRSLQKLYRQEILSFDSRVRDYIESD